MAQPPRKTTPGNDLPSREIYTFDVPEGAVPGLSSIGVVILTPSEEKIAMSKCKEPMSMVFELAKASFVSMNGETLRSHDGSKDKAYHDIGPQGRHLLIEAYSDITQLPEEVVPAFLKSRRVTSG